MTAQIIDFAQKKRERDERILQEIAKEDYQFSPEELALFGQHIRLHFVIDAKTHEILSSGEKDKE